MNHRSRGYTLVELLVVVAIVLILIALLLPSLSGARTQAQTLRCANHLRQNGNALLIYAARNAGRLPAYRGGGAWLWDLPYDTRDAIVNSGATRETMYCPLNPEQNTDGLWNFHRYPVTGYFWLLKRIDGNYPSLAEPKAYQRHVFPKRSSELEIITDATVSQNGSFTAVWGTYHEPHSTNHLKQIRPRGGNIFFLDGHLEWRAFSDMAIRARSGSGPPSLNMEMWF